MKKNIPIVLSIAGSDSSGGAGIQADIKTLNTMNVFAATAVTCVTAQNTQEVSSITKIPPSLVEAQILSVKKDFKISAIKLGMLYDKEIMAIVVKSLKSLSKVPIIVDPVMVSKSGDKLLKSNAIEFFKNEIIPIAYILTPNLDEALKLTGMREINSKEDIKKCCVKLRNLGAKNILLKGGHIQNPKKSIDYLLYNKKIYRFESKRYETKNTHGTGCTLSAAISGNIAKGIKTIKAIKESKKFVSKAIKNSLDIGNGNGPLNHFP
tara:strand:- start:8951 stop:9745 length:795 start_codon:yes stop_codon:yes gene_type:complete